MLKAEKGNQWPLSCYGPFQAKPCFPGFEDKSFEEVRLGFYEAQQNGPMLEQYKQQLAALLQEARIKIISLQTPTLEASNMLKNIYYCNQNTFNDTQHSVFANKPTVHSSSIFGNTTTSNTVQQVSFAQPENKNTFGNVQSSFQPANPIFGNTNQNLTSSGQTIFGASAGSQNIFASAAQNIFGSTAPTQNIFGNATANQNMFPSSNQNVFTSAAANQNIFTNSATNQNAFIAGQNFVGSTTNTSSIFGGPTQSQAFGSQPVFQNALPSANTSSAPSSYTQSIFGSSVTSSPSQTSFGNIFQSQNTASFASPLAATESTAVGINPFQPSSNTPNAFQQINSQPFPQVPVQNSVFGNQNIPQSHSSNIFGNKPSQNTTVNRVDDPTIYSKIDELTSNDIAQFESKYFEFGKIPVRPPAIEMC